jgi:DNA-binding MarR family transcriptional regulator
MTKQHNVLQKFRPRGFDCMCGNVRMASRSLTSVYDEHLRPSGLRSTQLAVLWAVIAISGATVGRIAKTIAMDNSTLTRTLKLLERDKLIALRSGADRRQKQVRATARGEKAFTSAMPLWEAAQKAVIKRLKGRRLADVNGLLLNLSHAQRH